MTMHSRRPRCRAVIIDDEPLVAMTLKDMVVRCGADVVGVAHHYDGGAALLADDPACDLAFIDLWFGNALRGVDLARQAVSRGIQVVAVTGSGRLPEDLPGAALLTKPFSTEAVRLLVNALGVRQTASPTSSLPAASSAKTGSPTRAPRRGPGGTADGLGG
jgi:DNA-binding NarL/FixJ family response regulator